jgi:hypothetical protein
VFIIFDSFPPETGWAISSVATDEIVAEAGFGNYTFLNESITEVVTLNAGEEYVFTIEDAYGDGLCCINAGVYLVLQGDVELVSGGDNFGSSESTFFTTLIESSTGAPISSPTTETPISAPTTDAPVAAPTSEAPVTPAPVAEGTGAPSSSPTTETPIAAPTTDAPVAAPTTAAPVTPAPVAEGTEAPGSSPTTETPIAVPTTDTPVAAPTTATPVEPPVAITPTDPLDVDVTLTINFDDFPQETGWVITSVSTGEVVASEAVASYSPLASTVTEVVTLVAGEEYVFLIEDSFGDGLCCPNAGNYVVTQGTTELVSGGGDFESEQSTNFFALLVSSELGPTTSPTQTSPTSAPVSQTPAQAVVDTEVEVTVYIIFDDYFAAEISWAISRVDTGEIVAAAPVGSYPLLTADVTVPVTVMEGVTYEFCIKDIFGDGLSSPGSVLGSYAILQGTGELISGSGNFGQAETQFFTPLVL